jgi:hypothetical protein
VNPQGEGEKEKDVRHTGVDESLPEAEVGQSPNPASLSPLQILGRIFWVATIKKAGHAESISMTGPSVNHNTPDPTLPDLD